VPRGLKRETLKSMANKEVKDLESKSTGNCKSFPKKYSIANRKKPDILYQTQAKPLQA